MHFPWFQGFGKVFAIRSKRPKNQGRSQHNMTTADNEGDTSITTVPSNPVPTPMLSSNSLPVHSEALINRSSTRYSRSVSLAREASDMAQVALPFVHAIAGAIPLAGAPMQAAIGGLLTGLQTIDVSARLLTRISFDPKGHHRNTVRTRGTLIASYYDSTD
jgi:hypothetical protein